MTSDLARAVKGSSGFLNGPDPCKDFGLFGASASLREVGCRVRFGLPFERKREG